MEGNPRDSKHQLEVRNANPYGSAHLNPADAYRDVSILKRPVWNHEVAAYFYLGGISAGAAIVGSLAQLLDSKQYKNLTHTTHYVSFATFLPCPFLLIDDLGVPSRFHHMLRIFKPSSPMNLGAWAFLLHGMGATFTVGRMLAADGKLPLIGPLYRLLPEQLLTALALPSSLTLAGYTGVLLGTTSIPVWNRSPLIGGLFTASAFSAGAAAVSLTANARNMGEEEHTALNKLALASGATELALLAGYIATLGSAAKPYRNGETGVLMVGAAASTLLATLLEAIQAATTPSRRHNRLTSILANLFALAGGALLRWAVVRAGHISASDREGTLEAMKPRKSVPGWTSAQGSR